MIPLDLSCLTESNHSNIGQKNSQYDLSEILSQPAIPIERNIQKPSCNLLKTFTATVMNNLFGK